MIQAVHQIAARVFGCDLRSLAVWRMALGLLLLGGLLLRLPELPVHYTDAGAWPIAAAREDTPAYWSVYFLHGSAAYAAVLFGLSALAALALLLGWQTRVATIVSWVLLVSLQTRNDLILNGGDVLLRLLLFWAIFLPTGACWSLDARRKKTRTGGSFFSAATMALLLQVVVVYVFNALYKTGSSWHTDASAIEETLRLETYVTPLGHWLLGAPAWLLQGSTRVLWWLELLGPLLAFVPWKNVAFRCAAAVIFMGFHFTLFCTIRIGLFPLIGMAAWIPFLPGRVWGRQQPEPEPEPGQGVPSSPRGWGRVAQTVFVLAALALILALNGLRYAQVHVPAWMRASAYFARLDQKWQLFAPHPLRSEGWQLVVLECSDGVEYDALTGKEVDWERPASLATGFSSVNWRKFFSELRNTQKPKRVRWLVQWYVREWEQAHPGLRVQRARLHYLWEYTSRRQNPPDHYLVYENPPGPLTEQARKVGQKLADPGESADN